MIVDRQPDQQIIPQSYGAIRYQRTGNFAHDTKLDKTVVDRVMSAAKMEHDINIIDSNLDPEAQIVRPSSDTLAWQQAQAPSQVNPFRSGNFRFYELSHDIKDEVKVSDVGVGIVEPGGNFEMRIFDSLIEESVKNSEFKGIGEYRNNYLRTLDSVIRLGMAEALFREKLGWMGHKSEYLPYLVTIGGGELMAGPDASAIAIGVGGYILANIYANRDRWEWGHGFFQNRSVFGALLMPLFPIDHFAKGAYTLARNRLLISADN